MIQQPMDSFEQWLEAAGRSFQYPPTPPLAARVAVGLRAEPRPRRRLGLPPLPLPLLRHGLLRGVAVVVLAMALVVGIVAAASPSARSALAEFLGLKRLRVVLVEETPTPAPTITATLTPGASSDRWAGRTTLAEAQRRAAFPVRAPAYPPGLGELDAVYFQDLQPGQQVIMVYRARPELDLGPGDRDGVLFTLFQFRTEGFFQKLVAPGTLLEELRVNEAKALWFQGRLHILQYRDASGTLRVEFERQVNGNTLAWEVGDVTYRLETSLPKEEAVRVAASVRKLPP